MNSYNEFYLYNSTSILVYLQFSCIVFCYFSLFFALFVFEFFLLSSWHSFFYLDFFWLLALTFVPLKILEFGECVHLEMVPYGYWSLQEFDLVTLVFDLYKLTYDLRIWHLTLSFHVQILTVCVLIWRSSKTNFNIVSISFFSNLLQRN